MPMISGTTSWTCPDVGINATAAATAAPMGNNQNRFHPNTGVASNQKTRTVIPARNGRRHVLHLMSAMASRPRLERSGGTRLEELLHSGFSVVKRRSLVFVVSDFISAPGWAKPLALLARRHEVIAVRLYDPLEMELPDIGLFVMQDAETGEQLFIDTHDKGFRKRFAELARRRELELREAFRDAGVDALELATDDALADAILRFADLRKRRSRLAAGAVIPRADPHDVVPLA